MRFDTVAIALTFPLTALAGQSPSLALSSPLPITVAAATGNVTDTASLPAGAQPLLLQNLVAHAFLGSSGTSAALRWNAVAAAERCVFELAQATNVGGALPGSAAIGPVVLVLTLQHATAAPATLVLRRQWFGAAGTPTPLVRVDVGADGTYELTEGTAATQFVGVQLGPTPLQVRVEAQLATNTAGIVESSVVVEAVRSDTFLQPAVVGCSDTQLAASPLFDGSVVFAANGVLPAVLVLGLAAQPLILPASTPPLPCVLMPRADAVVFGWPYVLPVPASVRPVQVWAQSVELAPAGLLTTNGLRVLAN